MILPETLRPLKLSFVMSKYRRRILASSSHAENALNLLSSSQKSVTGAAP